MTFLWTPGIKVLHALRPSSEELGITIFPTIKCQMLMEVYDFQRDTYSKKGNDHCKKIP